MGYARAYSVNRGDYLGGRYRRGGIFRGLKTLARGALGVAGGMLPGPLGGAARGLAENLRGTPTVPSVSLPAGVMPGGAITPTMAAHGVQKVGISPLGTVGIKFKKHRHMNASNSKAARRAIRRIKAARHLLQSIERELPRRPSKHNGSRGIITAAEARRALSA